MTGALVRYRVKADRADENARLVRGVFDALERERPPGLRYAAFRQDDGVGFVHVVWHEQESSRDVLRALPAFQAFAAGVKERCEEAPVTVKLERLGSYRAFDP